MEVRWERHSRVCDHLSGVRRYEEDLVQQPLCNTVRMTLSNSLHIVAQILRALARRVTMRPITVLVSDPCTAVPPGILKRNMQHQASATRCFFQNTYFLQGRAPSA
jgi:hypothetical protein